MLVGQGALGASKEVGEVAEILGAGVAKALLGKAVLDDDLPYVTGSIGLLGTKPSWDIMNDCDTLLMVGSGFPYWEFLPQAGQARGVQIDIDGRALGLRYPMEVNLTGDAAETLRALRACSPTSRTVLARKHRAGRGEVGHTLAARALADAGAGVNPQRVFCELSPRLPDDVILAVDSGPPPIWYARDSAEGNDAACGCPAALATMGRAMPYAIAAKSRTPIVPCSPWPATARCR